ncbi:MAG: VWA domain-containing protein [Verrucomicrobiota bacterium]
MKKILLSTLFATALSTAISFGQSASAEYFPSGTKIKINQIVTDDYPEVTLYTTITRAGVPLAGLSEENFRIREDGIDQQPLTVESQAVAIKTLMLIDVSGSMKNSMEKTKEAALDFIDTLLEGDQLEIMTFHEQVETIYPLGSDFKAASEAIRKLRHRGDTALYDGLYAAVNSLNKEKGRKAIVVLSDGVDDDGYGNRLSKRNLSEPLLAGMQSNIPIYTIGLGTNMDEGVLRAFAGTTGADYVNAPDAGDLQALYEKISAQLAGQYAIKYHTKNVMEGGVRDVRLDLVMPSRKPYAAPDPEFDEDGKVISYKAPQLDDREIQRLASLSGMPALVEEIDDPSVEKFKKKKVHAWPDGVPAFPEAKEVSVDNDKGEISFAAKSDSDTFLDEYQTILSDEGWAITNRSKVGSAAILQAQKGKNTVQVGTVSSDEKEGTEVTINYELAKKKPLVMKRNNSSQIIAANGREVQITANDSIIVITGGSPKLTISGKNNSVQADRLDEIIVSGEGNITTVSTLGKGSVAGKDNKLEWARGAGGASPKVSVEGDENQVTRVQ